MVERGRGQVGIERGRGKAEEVVGAGTRGRITETETLEETAGGAGGFGSTGTKG